MTIEPLKVGYTKDEFSKYVENEVAKKMGAWRPRGIVLHNTWHPNLALAEDYIAGTNNTGRNINKKTGNPYHFNEAQLIDNWWVTYRNNKWFGGPHLFIFRDKIWTANPLWIKGTHSPSYNSTYWGVELVGEYDKEQIPLTLRDNAVHAMACLYAMIGREPTPTSLRFHGEDPRTTHKGCPGRNVHPKVWWDVAIEKRMAELFPGGDYEKD